MIILTPTSAIASTQHQSKGSPINSTRQIKFSPEISKFSQITPILKLHQGVTDQNKIDRLHSKLGLVFHTRDPLLKQGRQSFQPSWFGTQQQKSNNSMSKEFRHHLKQLKTRAIRRKEAQNDTFSNQIDNKKTTLLNFGFRTTERESNRFIRPLIRMVEEESSTKVCKPTLMVTDLWSDKNISCFLKRQAVSKDMYLMKRIVARKENSVKQNFSVVPSESEQQIISMVYKHSAQQIPPLKGPRCQRQFLSQTNLCISHMLQTMDDIHQDNVQIHRDLSTTIKRISRAFIE